MALPKHRGWTIEEFRKFVARPENSDRLFELINGEIIEKMPGRTSNSGISYNLAFRVRLFCEERKLPCYISGGDGAYDVQGHVVAPDFAYKTTPLSDDYPDPVAPEWAIEIISPGDKASDIRNKRNIYIEAGILYGELYPESQGIDVYTPGQPKRTIGIDDTLDGGDVLPGFSLPVKEIFAQL
jgi:Uma2 family endonuclease